MGCIGLLYLPWNDLTLVLFVGCGNCLVFVRVISSILASSLLTSIYFTGLNSYDSKERLIGLIYFLLSGLKLIVLSWRLTSRKKDCSFLKDSLWSKWTMSFISWSIIYYLLCFSYSSAYSIVYWPRFFFYKASRFILLINFGSYIKV